MSKWKEWRVTTYKTSLFVLIRDEEEEGRAGGVGGEKDKEEKAGADDRRHREGETPLPKTLIKKLMKKILLLS